MNRIVSTFGLCILGAALLASPSICTSAKAAETLMGSAPWNYSQTTSRASIAALQMQHDGYGSGSGGNACGGGGTATATANYTCIIINGSDGSSINGNQGSAGNQDADSTTSTTNNKKSLSSILESLQ